MIPMNPLYEKFPDYVEVRGKRCRIVTDFREWIKLVELLDDEGVPGRKKTELLIAVVYRLSGRYGRSNI